MLMISGRAPIAVGYDPLRMAWPFSRRKALNRMADQGLGHRQRLKDRFLNGAIAADDDQAVLELLLTFAIPRLNVQPHAARLLQRFGTLDAVLAADAGSLRQIDGIGEQATALLRLVDSLANRRSNAPAIVCPPSTAVPQEDAGAPAADVPIGATIARVEQPPTDQYATQPDIQPEEDSLSPARTDETHVEADTGSAPTAAASTKKDTRQRPRGTLLFSGVILADAIALLPEMPLVATPTEARTFFREHLRFNAAETRDRFASYIVQRMFPDGTIDQALPRFARAFAGRQELRDVCFYRLCKAEPIMGMVAQEVLLPAMAQSELPRSALVAYLRGLYPASKSVDGSAGVIARALADANIARATPTTLTISYRPITLPAFAFVLSSEFPPGIHAMGDLARNQAVRALLWDPTALAPALYELRNQGLISKVSEIDSVRQFTTRFTPEQVVERMVAPGITE